MPPDGNVTKKVAMNYSSLPTLPAVVM